MSTNNRSGPSERPAGKKAVKRPGNTDLRIRRTRARLGAALIALIEEKAMDEVTVREVLERAQVGRSTFYVHYEDKDDLFLSQLEEGLQMWSNRLISIWRRAISRAELRGASRRLASPFRISGNSMPAPTRWPAACCHF